MEDSSDVTTIHSYFNSAPASPCLVSFEYGSLAKDEASKLRCSMYVAKNGSQKQTLIVSKGNQCYKGKVNSKSLCHTLLLVRNKKTNKARLISTFSCMLESFLKERKSTTSSDNDVVSNLTNLSQTFGSKKAKRISDLGMRMKINAPTLQDDVKKIISEINVKGSDVIDTKSTSDETIIQLLPPCNREAEQISDVYRVEDLLNDYDLNALDKAVSSLSDEKEEKSTFLETYYNKLGCDAPPVNLKLIIYADSLLRFINMGAIDLKNKNCLSNICPTSKLIGLKILNGFSVYTGNTRNRPVSYKDRAVCCIMISILLACNYKMDLEFISSQMKGYHQKKLLQLVKTVGAVPGMENGQKVYVLKLPLPKLPSIAQKKK